MPVTRSTKLAKDVLKGKQTQDPSDAVSRIGSRVSDKSKVSKGSNKARAELLMAELKEKQLREELALETEEYERKRALLRAKNEVETARLQIRLSEETDDSVTDDNNEEDTNDRILEYIEDCSRVNLQTVDTPGHSVRAGTVWNSNFNDVKNVDNNIQPMLVGLDLPKVELSTFDGNPATYWKFIRQFEYYVETKTKDDGQRLLYLLHYCRGRAREAIDECIMLPPYVAYKRARGILKDLFGQPHHVARTLLDNLLSGIRMVSNTAEALSRLSIKMQNCEIALSQMDYTSDLNSLTTLEAIVRSLPGSLQNKWAETVDKLTSGGREPTFADLNNFISVRARIARSRFGLLADECERKNRTVAQPIVNRREERNKHYGSSYASVHRVNGIPNDQVRDCLLCKAEHSLDTCPSFVSQNVPERWRLVRQIKVCFNCFEENHNVRACKLEGQCGIDGCSARHHRLLHTTSKFKDSKTSQSKPHHCGATDTGPKGVALGIVPVRLQNGNAEITAYALLDSGSDTSLIRGDVLERLHMKTYPSCLTIKTVNGSCISKAVSENFEVFAVDNSESISIDQAFVVPSLPINFYVSSAHREAEKWSHLRDLPFNDADMKEVVLLVGCDVPEAHWVLDQRLGRRKQPYAVKTLLGWVLLGPLGCESRTQAAINCMHREESAIVEQLKYMYDSEFADTNSFGKSPSVEDETALNIVKSQTHLKEGHYVIPLPWRLGVEIGASNYEVAISRLEHLRRRFLRDKEYFMRYTKVIEDNIKKGYAVEVPPYQLDPSFSPRWYLPHHGVINPKKPEKLRVVYDCAAKYKGKALNDMLYQGPDTTADLVGVLLRFRKEPIAVVADIEEMFMQVRVPEDDRGALRFLWWPDNDLSANPVEFQLTAHPFGATSSPFCSNFALRQTVEDFGDQYCKIVSDAVNRCFYVDDCLISLATVAEAHIVVTQLCEMLIKGGFRLRKWFSNCPQVLETLPPSERAHSTVEVGPQIPTINRVLGLEWNAIEDEFHFRFDPPDKPCTRRGILASVSSLYDPLGLIAPFCLPAKLLLQKLCKNGLGWDQPIDRLDAAIWKKWIATMKCLDKLRIPRCIKKVHDHDQNPYELHIFCDASQSGYGVAAYVREKSEMGNIQCSLLCGKARVAPLKTVTVPRLELSAAVLAIRVGQIVMSNVDGMFQNTFYWTDSMTVIYYINNVTSRFGTFVANRLSMIRENSHSQQWNYVPSRDNPADLASRGITDVEDFDLWINGPQFLRQARDTWPKTPNLIPAPANLELKKDFAVINTAVTPTFPSTLWNRYSSWFKLSKAIAWLIRFKNYFMSVLCLRHSPIKIGRLELEEIENAQRNIIRMVQGEAFSNELALLSKSDTNKRNLWRISSLQKLCPILENELIRVGGRFDYSQHEWTFKHPIILPNRHIVTELIIKHYHLIEGHSGASHTLAAVRKQFWVLQGGSAVKRVISRCMVCKRLNAAPGKQMMAPLPLVRIQPGWHPFTDIGLDYFGPFKVKRGRTLEKRYGCVITCLQTRAVHIEVAHSLLTDSFLMVLMRFVARRGVPKNIYSDNGSNLLAADKEIKNGLQVWIKIPLIQNCCQKEFSGIFLLLMLVIAEEFGNELSAQSDAYFVRFA